jgi:hypothetical protein
MVCELLLFATKSSHILEIFELGLLKPRPVLAFGHMEVRLDPDASEVSDQITYLYKWVHQTMRARNLLNVTQLSRRSKYFEFRYMVSLYLGLLPTLVDDPTAVLP